MEQLMRRFKIDVVLIMLTIFAMIFKVKEVELAFGININISLVFIILIMLCFGIKKALFIEGTLIVFGIIFLNGEIIQVINIIQLIFLWYVCIKKFKLNIILGEIALWTVVIVPFACGMHFFTGSKATVEYYKFAILFLIINGILNVFLAEIIYVYFIKVKIYRQKINLKYIDIIIHTLALAIVIPFVINMYIDLGNSYKNICRNVEELSAEIYRYIDDELSTWSETSITNLKLAGVIEKGILEENIKKVSRYKEFDIRLQGSNGTEILYINNYEKEKLNYEKYEQKKLNETLSKVRPLKKNYMIDNHWVESYFVYTNKIINNELIMRIEVPTATYNKSIIKEHISRFKLLFLITAIIGFLAMILNKVIFNNLYKLSMITKGLSEKIENNVEVEWEEGNIFEIRNLEQNIREMSDKLRENFIKLNKTQNRLYELAYYDTLTKLPNRSYFKKYLDELILKNKDSKICVMFIDLNRFKVINDTWGHYIGDKFLIKVAERFKKLKNKNCKVFRLGGDEFVFVVKINTNEEIKELGKGVIKSFEEEFKIDDLMISSTCSIGVSIYPDDSKDIDIIIKYADIAMYTSKENGGNYVQLFNEEINEKLLEKVNIEEGIKNGIEDKEFLLYYQPKFSGNTLEIKSLEALIRWNKDGNLVPPNKFIPIAEESDLILEIDKWVIYEACQKNKYLQDIGCKKVPISVNVSAKHFSNHEILEIIKDALIKAKLEPKYLTVEITEGVLIKNVDMVSEMIVDLKKMGINVSIDDFGKGYSSINQLMALPINEVKIDRDFVKNIHENEKKKIVVKLIVEIAHSLELNVVAEGIELEEEKEYLESIRCDELQGYLFSRPVELENLIGKMRGRESEK
ncbi:MAG: putative bifunctional diguanylate cyclase/phosphodiesterase [Clostridium sp.]